MIITSEGSIAEKQYLIDSLQSTISAEDTLSRADFIHEVGVRWYFRELWKKTDQSDYLDAAIAAFRQASDLKQSVHHTDTTSLAKSLYNLGYFTSLKTAYIDAIATYDRIIALRQMDRRMANAYRELGNLLSRVGDYYRALEMFEAMVALGHSLQLGGTISQAYYGLIKTYNTIDPIEYQDSIRLNIERAERWLAEGDIELPYILKHAKATQLAELGQVQEAIEIFMDLLDISNPAHLAQVHNNLGYIFVGLDSLELARHHLRKSIELNDRFSFAHENMGDAWLASGDYDRAMMHYDSAVNLALAETKEVANFSTFSSAYLNTLNYITSKARALLTIYEHEKEEQFLHDALVNFYQADSLVDVIRFQCTEDQSKFFWREQASRLYVNAVKTCALLQQPEKAYYFMEKNKAILLLEELSNEQARHMAKLPRNLVARELGLKKKIYQLQAQGVEQKQALEQAKKDYHVLIDSLVDVYPTYGKLKRRIDILPYEAFQEQYTGPNRQVVHFITSDTLSYGLRTSSSGSELYRIPNDYLEQLDTVIQLQQRPIVSQAEAGFYARNSNDLISKLLPASDLSEGKSQLLLLPGGKLHELAFEGLCASPNKMDHFLIESQIIHYSQSISLLDAVARRQRRTTENVVAFAPVTFPELPALPETEQEVKVISDLLGGTHHLKAQATKEQFRKEINDYKIIHLATHANAPKNDEPWIAFHDSTLTLSETYGIPNLAELVVLGACNTSIGTLQAGEGMISMTRGFFYSGTNSVISTLWSAHDETTSQLLIDFYQVLDGGANKSASLHEAKMAFLGTADGSLRSPYYWASLVLVGSDRPISGNSSGIWMILLALIFLLLVLAMVRQYRMRSRMSE